MGFKIFSSFISVLIIFIIAFLTFFSNPESKLNYYSKFQLPQDGVFSVIRDKGGNFIEVAENKESQIFLERFNFLDKIFYNKKGSYTKTQKTDKTSMKLTKGKYFLTFSFPKKYEVYGSGYRLNFVGPIKIFINTEEENKIDIFSFDNIVELTLFGLNDGLEKTKMQVYPHMLFPMDLELNKIIKNADFFRIMQLNQGIEYVNKNLFTNDYRLDNVTNLDNYFFRSVLNYNTNEYISNKGDVSLLSKNYNSMTYDYIKKYFYVFINDNKKISFYKDLIYMNLLKIYMSPKNSNSLYTETEEYYKKLGDISKKDYTEMLKVLVYFKNKFLLDNNIDNIEKELKYDQILSSVFSFQKNEGNYMLYYIYNLYDLGKKEDFFEGLISFSDSYFKNNGLKIQEDKLLGYDDTKNIKLGYYVSFLENIIKSHLDNDSKIDNIKGVFSLFNKYSLLSVKVFSGEDNDKKRTIIVSHLELLKILSEYIRNNFFENELDKGIMLVIKKGVNIEFNVITMFERSYNNIIDFFTLNKNALDENKESDSLNLKEYEFISYNFIDYISALKNYDKYKLEKSDLYKIETIGGDDLKKVIYNVDDIKTYLTNFNGVSMNSIIVKTDEQGNMYNVNIDIGGKDFSFDLYPYNNYSIKNIYIDGVKKNLTYSLNLIKEKMDEKFKNSSSPEERNTNDFKNFFLNTFLKTKTFNPVVEVLEKDIPKEPTEILVFKRDKLLGSKGEFSNIRDFTSIGSENITVTVENEKIKIKLKDVRVSFTYNVGNESNTFGAYIDSDYNIGNNEHYFTNTEIKIFKYILDGNRNTEYFGLGDNKYIKVLGNIPISSFKDYMSDISSYYNNIVFVSETLENKVGQVNISVNTGKIVKYDFSYNGKQYELLLLKSSVISLKRDGEKLIQNTFNYTDLPNRIDLLIK